MKGNRDMGEHHFKPEEMRDGKCHCLEPMPSNDKKKCLKCHGDEPKEIEVKKKVRKKK